MRRISIAIAALMVASPAMAKPGDCLKWLNILSDLANLEEQNAESNAREAAMTGRVLDSPDLWVTRQQAVSSTARKARDACLEELSR